MKKLYGTAILFAAFACANMHAANKEASMQGVFEKLKVLLNKYAGGDWNSWNQQDWDNLAYLQGDAAAIEPKAQPFLDIYLKDYSTIKDAAQRKKLVGLVSHIAPRVLTGLGLKRIDLLTLKTEIQSIASLSDETSKSLAVIFAAREKELAKPIEQPKPGMPAEVKPMIRPQEPRPVRMQPARLPVMPKPVDVGQGQQKPSKIQELERAMVERKKRAELGPVMPGRLPVGPAQPGQRLPQHPIMRDKPVQKATRVRREAGESQVFARHYAEFKKKHADGQQPMPVQVTQQPTAQPVSQSVQEVERAEEAAITRRFLAASKESNIKEMEKIYGEAKLKFINFRTIPSDFLMAVLAGYEKAMNDIKGTLQWGRELPIARFRQHGIETPEEYEQILSGQGGEAAGNQAWKKARMAGELREPSPLMRTELAEFERLRDDFYAAAQEGDSKKMEASYKVAQDYYKKLKTIPEQQWQYRLEEMHKMMKFLALYDEFLQAAAKFDLYQMDEIYDEAEEIAEKTFVVQRLPYFELLIGGFSKGPSPLQELVENIYSDHLSRMEKLIADELKRRHNQPSARDGA